GFRYGRPLCREAGAAPSQVAVVIGGDRGDAVDHAVREWHVGVDPIGQFGVLRPGEGSEHAVGVVSVALDVVAAHHGERGRAAFATAAQRLDHVAEVGAGGGSGFEIGAHGGVVEVELAGDLVDVV